MNLFLALLTSLLLVAAASADLAAWVTRRSRLRIPFLGRSGVPASTPVPEGMMRLLIYECPSCGRRNRLKEGFDPRFSRCGRCFAEMGTVEPVDEELAPAEPDARAEPLPVWVLQHEDLPARGPAPQPRTLPRFEVHNPIPADIHWQAVDPRRTTLRGTSETRAPNLPDRWPDVIGNVDPVTGTPIRTGEAVYLCTHCTAAYHAQTWQYLRDQNAGACAACNRQNTVVPYPSAS